MYYLIIGLVLVGGGLWLIRDGIARSNRSSVIAGVGLILLAAGCFGLMSLWGEMLWFEALGYGVFQNRSSTTVPPLTTVVIARPAP